MKIHARKNHRVIIIPNEPWFLSKDHLGMTKENFVKIASNGKDIVDQVKRHIDGYTDVYYDYDASDICSFCRNEWEEDEDGCPVCCQKAVDEWEANKAD